MLRKNVFPKYNLKSESSIEKQYLTAMLSGAFFGILGEWINQGKKESPAQLIQLMSEKVIPSLKNSQLL
ncbi:TetR-like C-terminal domain-containing protein [Lentilactobacillus kosonis]|uniref:Transcriptional regulator, TetR family n=1 Tax=Lentilactobacillus kosonis TaxID=2810561 RepID=A0A401FHW5_9LACO|nr:transcriptional regulator, TetR family [Lentilactobacillus kosonis]